MAHCPNCEVELEEDVLVCPLCEQSVTAEPLSKDVESLKSLRPYGGTRMSQPAKKETWEIVTVIMISAIVATCLLNWILEKRITWSEYPVAICLTIFSYFSIFAFWRRKTMLQIIASFIIASLLILFLDSLTRGIQWSTVIGIPLLFIINLVSILLLWTIRLSKHKGINLVGYTFIAAAILCIGIEVILDLHIYKKINLQWSLIVSASVLPIAMILLFMHFRFKKGRDLNRTFHV